MTTNPKQVTPEALALQNIFTYHAPFGTQPERYAAIRLKAYELGVLITESCPSSRERSLALTNLEQSIFWANASIARNEKPSEPLAT